MATPQQIALSALLHRSPDKLPIPGTSSKEHLRENWGAGKILLDDSDIKKLWD
jgi:pyridoxine 4-dehydrogenase